MSTGNSSIFLEKEITVILIKTNILAKVMLGTSLRYLFQLTGKCFNSVLYKFIYLVLPCEKEEEVFASYKGMDQCLSKSK